MTILDSGKRQEYSTGAVRDITEGKGRCDLLPLGVVGNILQDVVIAWIGKYQQEKEVGYLYNAVDLAVEKIFEGNKPHAMLEVAKHFEEGAKKYGDNNWQKGIPVDRYIDSAVRHYLKWLDGWTDEPHDRATLWNLMCCIWTIEHIGDGD
jgi:hypothetical protein